MKERKKEMFRKIFLRLLKIFGWAMSDKRYLMMEYRIYFGRKLNLDTPHTFNEKLQWLKLYNRKTEYTDMVDKVKVKSFVARTIGEEYVIPLIGVWKSADEIDVDSLPNQFVLKTNHSGGNSAVLICRDKSKFDFKKAFKKLDRSLKKHDIYRSYREWPYKNIERRILAEELLTNDTNPQSAIEDFKFFCFNGEPRIMYVSSDGSDDPHTDFFDMDYNHLPIRMRDPNSKCPPKKPETFEMMRELARMLSAGIPHVRVDFYNVNNKIYFGELTFFHNSGFGRVNPEEWALKLGDMIELPKHN